MITNQRWVKPDPHSLGGQRVFVLGESAPDTVTMSTDAVIELLYMAGFNLEELSS